MGYAILDQRGGDSLTATTLDGYSLLADTTVGTATTTVNFTGLNIGWGDELLLVATFVSPTNNANFSLFVNGNNTQSNYYNQYIFANGTSVSANRSNESYLCYVDASSGTTTLNANIKISNNGYFVYQSKTNYNNSSSLKSLNLYNTSTFTISSITSLTIFDKNSIYGWNGISVGSRFQLYKSGGGASRTWAIT